MIQNPANVRFCREECVQSETESARVRDRGGGRLRCRYWILMIGLYDRPLNPHDAQISFVPLLDTTLFLRLARRQTKKVSTLRNMPIGLRIGQRRATANAARVALI
jgi:hypothetical protein